MFVRWAYRWRDNDARQGRFVFFLKSLLIQDARNKSWLEASLTNQMGKLRRWHVGKSKTLQYPPDMAIPRDRVEAKSLSDEEI